LFLKLSFYASVLERKRFAYCNTKNPRIKAGVFGVEPRGIEPLYPSVEDGFLTRGGPSDSTKFKLTNINTKRKTEEILGLSGLQLNPPSTVSS